MPIAKGYTNPAPVSEDDLERLIDMTSLAEVLETLAKIASEKAEHVRSTWQDDPLGREWDKRMILLDLTATKMRKLEKSS